MGQVCKRCNLAKAAEAFPTRHWGPATNRRSGPRKVCYDCQRVLDHERYHVPASKKRASRKAYYAANREASRAYGAAYYAANRDKWLNSETGWRNSKAARAYDTAYEQRPEVREAARARGKAWRTENKARLVVKTRKRQAHVARATPPWADPVAILAIYQQAERQTKETGERHEVDHVIPLQGKNVCGLHVETNLRVIPAALNRSKGHKFEPMMSLSSGAIP
jgi:hypothetical protein